MSFLYCAIVTYFVSPRGALLPTFSPSQFPPGVLSCASAKEKETGDERRQKLLCLFSLWPNKKSVQEEKDGEERERAEREQFIPRGEAKEKVVGIVLV